MNPVLNEEQRAFYKENGWLLFDDLLEVSVPELQTEVGEIASWDDSGDWLRHFEMTDFGPKLARTENFTPHSEPMFQLLRGGAISQVAGELLGEDDVRRDLAHHIEDQLQTGRRRGILATPGQAGLSIRRQRAERDGRC